MDNRPRALLLLSSEPRAASVKVKLYELRMKRMEERWVFFDRASALVPLRGFSLAHRACPRFTVIQKETRACFQSKPQSTILHTHDIAYATDAQLDMK